jgi:hypothetical protein
VEINELGLGLPPKQYFLIGPDRVNAGSSDGQSLCPRRLGISCIDVPMDKEGIAAKHRGLE